MASIALTPTSYVVLGLVEASDPGEVTPYDLKQLSALSVQNFWSFPHAQLYREPPRLAAAGLLAERRETAGRRRRWYRITADGRAALQDWRNRPPAGRPELRDPAVLKLFLGADPRRLAAEQVPVHRGKIEEYETLMATIAGQAPPGQVLALTLGIAYERAMLTFWQDRE